VFIAKLLPLLPPFHYPVSHLTFYRNPLEQRDVTRNIKRGARLSIKSSRIEDASMIGIIIADFFPEFNPEIATQPTIDGKWSFASFD